MNKTNKTSVRTDLAMEACELLSKEETYKGIETEMKRTDGIEITTVRVYLTKTNDRGLVEKLIAEDLPDTQVIIQEE